MRKTIALYSTLFGVWIACFLIFYVDHKKWLGFPPGCITVLLECCFELWILLVLISRNKPENRYFVSFFIFLLPSEFSYMFIHYFLRVQDGGVFIFSATTLTYSIAYILAVIGLIKNLDKQKVTLKWNTSFLLPVLLTLPVIGDIIVPLLWGNFIKNPWNIILIERIFNLFFATTLYFISIFGMLVATESVFSFACLAGIILQLGNWGIYAMLLPGNKYSFTEYELLWLCGIAAYWFAFIIAPKFSSDHEPRKETIVRSFSLESQQRTVVLGIISLTLLMSVFFREKNLWSYRVVFFGVSIGCVLALFIGELLSKQILHYSILFGRITNSTNFMDFSSDKLNIPIELWNTYDSVFLKQKQHLESQNALKDEIIELSAQVSHDIRSPLAALNVLVQCASNFPEDERRIVISATQRITDIANQLLLKGRAVSNVRASHLRNAVDSIQPQLLTSLVQSIVSEKRVQCREEVEIQIDSDIYQEYGLFSQIDSVEFKRTLSNLLDNAIESFPFGKGVIRVAVRSDEDSAHVIIQDNGKGIPKSVLERLGEMGLTYGKSTTRSGSGLGVYHAKKSIEKAKGSLQIVSHEGVGTIVTIRLPKVPAPAWFMKSLAIRSGMEIITFDDIPAIHQLWDARLKALDCSKFGIKHLEFRTIQAIRKWVKAQRNDAMTRPCPKLFLLDYEIANQSQNGIDLMEELEIFKNSVLVTSYYEDSKIQKHCMDVGVKIIPKELAAFIPIEILEG